jgi:hypothetical protein
MTIGVHGDSESEGLSKAQIKEVSRHLGTLEADFRDMLSGLDPLIERRLQELAGPHLETMLKSDGETLKYLTDADPKLREAALQLASQRWHKGNAPSRIIEEMAIADPSDDVRDTAIRALGNSYARTKDQRIGHLLAAAVRNDGLPDRIRLTAFMSLLRLHCLMDYSGHSPLVPLFLDQIDWAFVDYYHRGASSPGLGP